MRTPSWVALVSKYWLRYVLRAGCMTMVALPDPMGRVRYQLLRSRIPEGDPGSLIGVGAEVGVVVGTGVGVREGGAVDGGDGVGTVGVVGAGTLVVGGAGTLVGGSVDDVAA